MGVIYKITNTINSKCYIGYTTGKFSIRMRKHKNDDLKYGVVLGKAISKYGWENFKCEVVTETDDKEELLRLEKYYINYFNSKIPNGYNMTDGGERLFGDSNPFYGHKHTEETKKLLSEYMSKRTGDSNPFYGRHHSEESKKKIGGHRKKVEAVDFEGNVIREFSSQKEAGKWCFENHITTSKYANSDIAKRCKDGKCAFGYFWRYKNEGVETMPDECKAVG